MDVIKEYLLSKFPEKYIDLILDTKLLAFEDKSANDYLKEHPENMEYIEATFRRMYG